MPTAWIQQALDLPPEERGRALLEPVEDQWFERKSNRVRAKDLADVLVGFANAEGGTLIIGLWKGSVQGIRERVNRVNGWTQAAIDHTEPPVPARCERVECVNDSGDADELFVIRVEASDLVHTNRKDEVHLRVGDENRKLTYRQRQELVYDKGQTHYEATPLSESSIQELNEELLASYTEATKHPDPMRLLAARGLTTPRGDLTVAAYLLFGSHPQARFPEAAVRILRYRGVERGTGSRQQVIADRRLEGPIPHMLLQARDVIRDLEPSRRALGSGGTFEPVGLIPSDAWLEGLVNAVVHRSYSIAGDHIRVEIFDDRIEITSPGRFPGLVRLEDPEGAVRFARNPRIARVCADLNFGQELGEGIRRMFEEMRLAGLSDPLYNQTPGSVRLALSSTPVDRKLEARLPHGSRELLRLIHEAGRLGTGDLADAVDLSRPAVLKRLKTLEQAGLVRWVGKSPKDPRAYWEIP